MIITFKASQLHLSFKLVTSSMPNSSTGFNKGWSDTLKLRRPKSFVPTSFERPSARFLARPWKSRYLGMMEAILAKSGFLGSCKVTIEWDSGCHHYAIVWFGQDTLWNMAACVVRGLGINDRTDSLQPKMPIWAQAGTRPASWCIAEQARYS